MFAALGYGEQAKNWFRRWTGRIFGEKIIPVKVPVGCGECFFTAEVSPGARIRWNELFLRMGRLSREMIIPEELQIPDGCGITRFVPQSLGPRVVMNSALELLERYGGPRVPVTAVDPYGRLCGRIIPLVRCCADVRVVTDNPALYRRAAERIMEEYGASIQVCPRGESAIRPGVAVFPFGIEGSTAPADTVCIVPDGELPQENRITVGGIRLGEEYRAIKPAGLSDFLFASALYEKCGLREMGALAGSELKCGGTALTPERAAALFSTWNG